MTEDCVHSPACERVHDLMRAHRTTVDEMREEMLEEKREGMRCDGECPYHEATPAPAAGQNTVYVIGRLGSDDYSIDMVMSVCATYNDAVRWLYEAGFQPDIKAPGPTPAQSRRFLLVADPPTHAVIGKYDVRRMDGGTDTCNNDSLKRKSGVFHCSICGVHLDIAEMNEQDPDRFYSPRYCPQCRRRVVEVAV